MYVLSKDEGGRHTPFFKGYRPQFYFRTTDVTGSVLNLLSEDSSEAEMCMPGDNIKMTVELHTPIAMEESLRFAIREGGKTVGAGVVTKILAVTELGPDRGVPGVPLPEPGLAVARDGLGGGPLRSRGSGPRRRVPRTFRRHRTDDRRGSGRRCANTSGWNAPRAATGTTGSRKRPAGAERLELKKYCRRERKHTPHKESRKK